MKKLHKIFYIIVAVAALVAMMCVSASAVTTQNISLQANYKWTSSYSANRTGYFYDVGARCDSVYPKSGIDMFSKIRCRVVDSTGILIMENYEEYAVLDESDDAYTNFILKNGWLNTTTVYFQFCGNSSSAADAVVTYIGR